MRQPDRLTHSFAGWFGFGFGLGGTVASVDVMDVAGEHQTDIEHDIYKVPLNENGNPVAVLRSTCVYRESNRSRRAPELTPPLLARHPRRTRAAGTESSNEETKPVAAVLPENYCGSCYGAESHPKECCNSCAAVRRICAMAHTLATTWVFELTRNCRMFGTARDVGPSTGHGVVPAQGLVDHRREHV